MTIVPLLAALASATQGAAPIAGEVLTKEQAQARLSNCGLRRFQSVAEFMVDGRMKRSSLRLCARDEETAEQWLATLEKNEAIVAAETRLPESAKSKLLSDLRAEIERVKSARNSAIVGVGAGIAARPAPLINLPKSDFEVAVLPPLPPPKAAGPGPGATASISRPATSPATAVPAGLRPKLSVKCAAAGGSPIECDYFGLGDLFIVEAEEDISSPLTLTFRRTKSGQVAEVPIRRLKRGDLARVNVPPSMCKGVVRTTFDVQVTGAGKGGTPYSDLLGPFRKAC